MTAKLITSPANPIIKDIKALEQRKRRKETGLFMVEGLRSVIEGMELGASLKYIAYHSDTKEKDDIKRFVSYCYKCDGLPLEVNNIVLEKLSRKDNPQSVIGVFEQKFHKTEEIDLAGQRTFVALDQVRDPGNLGTIIRTVDAVGADGVILIGACCDPYSLEAVRATMGSIFSVRLYQVTEDQFTTWSKSWCGDIIATTLQSSVDFRTIAPQKPLLLMMGNEQAGLSPRLRALSTHNIRLPMNGRADSLNLAVATGICLYAFLEP